VTTAGSDISAFRPATAGAPNGNIVTATVKAWECIGCGNIEAPQTCIGVCQYRKVEFVYAEEHAQVVARLAAAVAQRDALAVVLRRLAFTTPRDGEWERALRSFREQARTALRKRVGRVASAD
jgi:hypothetical protein